LCSESKAIALFFCAESGDHRCFFLKCDRPAIREAFAKAIAPIAKEKAIALFFYAELGDRLSLFLMSDRRKQKIEVQ
jgi:molybdopterin-guanine dinucleotide biosynthesis protein A